MPSLGRIPIVALKPVSAGTLVWRRGSALQVTVILKATFGMVHEGNARLVAPLPLVVEDRYPAGAGSLGEPHDLAPFLPGAGVILSGAACSPQPVAAMTIRLALYRDRPLIDKVVHVFGDRPPGAATPAPFQKMPIAYERSFGGPAFPDNPVGTTPEGRAHPNFVHPTDPRRPVGFGPVSSRWGSRRRLLAGHAAPALEAPGETIAEGFDFRWFQAAPADQQCDYLQGDEWIVLDGMDATLPRFQTHLPGVRAQAAWNAAGTRHPLASRLVSLQADTLIVDAERHVCSLVFRGCFAVEHEGALGTMRVFAGVEMPGYPITWPDEARTPAPAPPPEPEDPPTITTSTEAGAAARPRAKSLPTEKIVLPRVDAPVLPFSPHAASSLPPPEPLSRRQHMGGSTVDGALISPFAAREALPFPATSPPFARSAPPEVATPAAVWRDDDSVTRMIDAPRPAAALPFASAAPSDPPPTSTPLPGAPWSGVAAEQPPQVEPDMSTVAIRVTPRPVTPSPLPPPVMAPPMITQAPAPPPMMAPPMITPLPAPPPMMAPPGLIMPALGASPRIAEAPSPPDPPALAAPPIAPPARLTPPADEPRSPSAPEPAPAPRGRRASSASTAARDKLLAAIAAGTSIAGLDLAGADLRELDLHDAKLGGAKLAGADLGGATLDGADLTAADLTGASLSGASFRRARLDKARLDGARGEGAIFDEASLVELGAPSVKLSKGSFEKANAERSSWERATLDDAVFRGANLRGADLSRGGCARARFEGADLTGADLSRLGAEGADFARAILDGANLRKAELRGANLDGASLRKVSGEKADLGGARLGYARLDGAVLRGATLAGASLARAEVEGADLGGADLRKANVFGVSLSRATTTGADLRDTIDADPDAR